MNTALSKFLATTFCLASLAQAAAPAWPQFRGPNGSGVTERDRPPVTFGSNTNLLWRTPLPPGHSSPIVWGDRIVVTALEQGQLTTLCLDRRHGNILWRKPAPVEKIESVHEFSSPASSTPTTDGERIYVYFGSFGLLAYDFSGNQEWSAPLPLPKTGYGTATSPILFGDLVVLDCDGNEGNSYLLAVNRTTGQTVWKKDRPMFSASWSTPIVWEHNGLAELIVSGSGRLVAYNPKDGTERWWVNGFPRVPITLPVAGDGLLFACNAGQGLSLDDRIDVPEWTTLITKYDQNKDGKIAPAELPPDLALHLREEVSKDTPGNYFPFSTVIRWFDEDKDGLCSEKEWRSAQAFVTENKTTLMAIRPGGHGDFTNAGPAWKTQRTLPEMPSPLFYRGRLYLVKDGGVVSCLEPVDGRVIYQERLGAPGQYCASPVAADGKIFAASVAGTVVVFQAGDNMEILARNKLDERVLATPAIADHKLYVRTAKHLFAFGESRP